MIGSVRQELERRARCVREVLGLGTRSVRQVTSFFNLHTDSLPAYCGYNDVTHLGILWL